MFQNVRLGFQRRLTKVIAHHPVDATESHDGGAGRNLRIPKVNMSLRYKKSLVPVIFTNKILTVHSTKFPVKTARIMNLILLILY